MNYNISAFLSFSVGIAVIISLVRFKQIAPAFRPFLFLLWLGLVNETTSHVLISTNHSNAVNTNIFLLLEALLLLWFFKLQRVFDRNPRLPWILALLYLAAWTYENFWISSLTKFNSYFCVAAAFIAVLCSIHLINRLLLTGSGRLMRNPLFILTIAFIIYYTYSVLVETFWIYGINESKEFRIKVYHILVYINCGTNLIYALAVLWMPAKQKFTLL